MPEPSCNKLLLWFLWVRFSFLMPNSKLSVRVRYWSDPVLHLKVLFELLSYLSCHAGLVFDVLADPRRLLRDAVGVEAVDFVLYGQGFCLLVFVGCNHNIRYSEL